MKLYLLEAIEGFGYDTVDGFVIRAESELDARVIADQGCGRLPRRYHNPWLDPQHTTCTEIPVDGPPSIIMRDFHAG